MDENESALDILRRIEPALAGVVADIKEIRQDIKEIRADIVVLKVGLAGKPSRGELWGGMAVMVALFAMTLAGIPVFLAKVLH